MSHTPAQVERPPRVSIILPTWNRAAFLPAALDCIARQTFADWELIVVDDGSTDDTEQVIAHAGQCARQPIRYVRRPNGGPGAARQTGVEHARGELLAFYDSDDLWLEHHLADSVAQLDAHPDVDWVFSSVRVVERATGRIVTDNVFQPRASQPMLQLRTQQRGPLHVIDDPGWLTALLGGSVLSGFQVSVLRRRVVEAVRIAALFVGEDLAFTGLALRRGMRLAWLAEVHVLYQVHDQNVSHSAGGGGAHAARVQRRYGHALRYLLRHGDFGRDDRRLLRQAVTGHGFWRLGYSVLWAGGQHDRALRRMEAALRAWPWSARRWKTGLACRLRHATRNVIARCRPGRAISAADARHWTTSGAGQAPLLPGSNLERAS